MAHSTHRWVRAKDLKPEELSADCAARKKRLKSTHCPHRQEAVKKSEFEGKEVLENSKQGMHDEQWPWLTVTEGDREGAACWGLTMTI